MKEFKKILIKKIIEIHKYLSELDKIDILKVKERANKPKTKLEEEILNEYIKCRRENNKNKGE